MASLRDAELAALQRISDTLQECLSPPSDADRPELSLYDMLERMADATEEANAHWELTVANLQRIATALERLMVAAEAIARRYERYP
jgi:hypothetical protein